MPDSESVRKRMPSLDGSTFRFERKDHTLFVNDMPVQIRAKEHGVVELVAEYKTVQVSGATYWEMIYEDLAPTKLLAGMILAMLTPSVLLSSPPPKQGLGSCFFPRGSFNWQPS